jgi:hypothetical protein
MKLNFLFRCVFNGIFRKWGHSKCSWSAKFLFDRQKVVIADRCDRERYFEPWFHEQYLIRIHNLGVTINIHRYSFQLFVLSHFWYNILSVPKAMTLTHRLPPLLLGVLRIFGTQMESNRKQSYDCSDILSSSIFEYEQPEQSSDRARFGFINVNFENPEYSEQ